MTLNLDFEELMKYTFICLKFNGSHPKHNLDLRWFINAFIQSGTYTCGLILMIHTIIKLNFIEDVIDILAVGNYVIIYCVCSFKHFIMLNYKSLFTCLMNSVKKDYISAESLPSEEQAVVKKYATNAQFVSKLWVLLTASSLSSYIFQPCSKMVYYSVTEEFRYAQIVPTVYPEFMKDWNESIVFCSVFALFVYFCCYSITFYLGVVPLGPAFLLHACGQLEILEMRMLKLFPDDGSVSFEQRSHRLKEIAIHMQTIYEFIERLGAALKLLYELSLKGTSLIAPVLLFATIEAYSSRGEIRMELIVILSGAFALSFQPCYYGDMLIEKSANLRDAVYMNGWEGLYEKKTRSTILILMTRMERNAAIRSIFVTICLDAFADVMHQAYALFNLLHAAF